MVKLLLANGAKPNIVNKNGQTALSTAADRKDAASVKVSA